MLDVGSWSGLTMEERAWCECLRAAAAAGRAVTVPLSGTREGREVVGAGCGGDATILLDRAAEEAMLRVLDGCAPRSARVVSEELGLVGATDAPLTLLVDPVDGSLNAKRGLPVFGATMALADGPCLGDVWIGYTLDFTDGAEYLAVRHRGLRSTLPPAQAYLEGVVELVLLEAGRPDRHAFHFDVLGSLAATDVGIRVRTVGSLALSLAYLALGRADVLAAPVASRSVDIAAGMLMVGEAGGGAASLDDRPLAEQPLDLQRRSPFAAWRAGLDGDLVVDWGRRLT